METRPSDDELLDDHSGRPAALLAALRAEGIDPKALETELPPRYGQVWRDIALAYAGIFASLLAAGLLAPAGWVGGSVAALLGGAGIGFFMALLQLFTHEAAHRNIAPSRALNDRLANSLLTIWLGQDIAGYRRVHFAHHRHLGAPEDPERSYFYQPGWRLLVETLFLVHVIRVFRQHDGAKEGVEDARGPLLRGLLLNGVLVLASWWLLGWPAAAAWVLGLLSFFPTFGTWRQLLEHRTPTALPEIDYAQQPQGAYTRSFGQDLGARLLGGAGFNRHLLHHWLPQISYTRFDALEQRLLQVPEARRLLAARRSSYAGTLKSLWKTT